MARPKYPVPSPQRTVFRPALRGHEETSDQALSHTPAVRYERQIDIDQRVGSAEPLPSRTNAAVAINDPFVLGRHLQVFLMRHSLATAPELHYVHAVQGQSRPSRQVSG